MLRMLLKRLIIICTRLLKAQMPIHYAPDELETIRKFHILVELHFREKSVSPPLATSAIFVMYLILIPYHQNRYNYGNFHCSNPGRSFYRKSIDF